MPSTSETLVACTTKPYSPCKADVLFQILMFEHHSDGNRARKTCGADFQTVPDTAKGPQIQSLKSFASYIAPSTCIPAETMLCLLTWPCSGTSPQSTQPLQQSLCIGLAPQLGQPLSRKSCAICGRAQRIQRGQRIQPSQVLRPPAHIHTCLCPQQAITCLHTA